MPPAPFPLPMTSSVATMLVCGSCSLSNLNLLHNEALIVRGPAVKACES